MQTIAIGFVKDKNKLYARASALALITIFYNIVEGLVSVFFGMADESMSLFGFGLDSFVEVVSGIGIWHMVRRIRNNNGENFDRFERKALRITGTAFFLLTAGLAVTADGGASLGFSDGDGKARAGLGVRADGVPYLVFADRDGRGIWHAP